MEDAMTPEQELAQAMAELERVNRESAQELRDTRERFEMWDQMRIYDASER